LGPTGSGVRQAKYGREPAVVASVHFRTLTHCAEGNQRLTGSPWWMAALLACGIDAGMCACEWALLCAHDSKAAGEVRLWGTGYAVASVGLSILLNCYAFSLHAPEHWVWRAMVLGIFTPSGVFAISRVAGKLRLSE
jgi:hypothetical protein